MHWNRSNIFLVVCTSTASPKHAWSMCTGLIQCSWDVFNHMQAFVWSICSRSNRSQMYVICSWSEVSWMCYTSAHKHDRKLEALLQVFSLKRWRYGELSFSKLKLPAKGTLSLCVAQGTPSYIKEAAPYKFAIQYWMMLCWMGLSEWMLWVCIRKSEEGGNFAVWLYPVRTCSWDFSPHGGNYESPSSTQ